MIFSAKDFGRKIEVTDVNGNLKRKLSDRTDVTLWNGEGPGAQFEGQLTINQEGYEHIRRADELLRNHGLLVLVNGSSVATW